MPSRSSNQQNRWEPWSWYGHWKPLNDAGQSWTWSSSQKGDCEWKLVTRKRKKWASGTVTPGDGVSSSTSSADKSAIKAHRTFLEVVLGDSGSQPAKHSEPEREKLAAETTSRIEKIEQLIALVGDDESLAGHNASLEQPKKRLPRSHDPLRLRLRTSLNTSLVRRLVPKLFEDTEKVKSFLETRIATLLREEGRLAELRAELATVPANMDVVATELKDLEREEIEQLRLLAVDRSRQNVAGEADNSLHLCVISWNVAGIPSDDLDVWLHQISDHFPWDLICLQEGFKRLNGIGIRVVNSGCLRTLPSLCALGLHVTMLCSWRPTLVGLL